MNHIAKIAQECQQNTTFIPDIHESGSYEMHHRREGGPIHERLFHHDKHEFWHGDARGVQTEELNALSIMPEWAGASPCPSGQSDQSIPSPWERSAKGTPGPQEDTEQQPKGEVNVEYRQTLLGLMEACERWGTRVEAEGKRTKRMDGDQSPATSRGLLTPAGISPGAGPSAGHAQAKGSAKKVRSKTPPPSSARSEKSSGRR